MSSMSNSSGQSGRANRWMLYGPFIAGGVIFIIYTIIWFVGAGLMKDQIFVWVDDQRSKGFYVSHGDVKVQGYPFLLRAQIKTPEYGSNEQGWMWQAEDLYVDTLPYNPSRLILSPMGAQEVSLETATANEVWALNADVFRVSLTEETTAFEFHNLKATPTDNTTSLAFSDIQISRLVANTLIKQNSDEDIGSFAIEGQGLNFTSANADNDIMISYMDAGVRASAYSTFVAANNNRTSFQQWYDEKGEIIIEGLRLIVTDKTENTPTQMMVRGNLKVDQNNYPAGRIDTTISEHSALLRILAKNNILSESDARSANSTLDMLSSAMSGELSVPITLKKGKAQIRTPLGGVTIARLKQLN